MQSFVQTQTGISGLVLNFNGFSEEAWLKAPRA